MNKKLLFSVMALLLLVSAPLFAVPPVPGRMIEIDDIFDTDVWDASGATTWDANNEQLILTGVTNYTHGRVFTKQKFDIEEFTVEFDMKIGGGTGADGIVFGWVTDYGWAPEPQAGGRIDFIPERGYGVEFDCHHNREYNDANGQHIAVVKNGIADHRDRWDAPYGAIENNQWHHVLISHRRGHIQVYFNGEREIIYQIPAFPHDVFEAHFGFTAATGALNNWHIIRNVQLTVFGEEEPPLPAEIAIVRPNGGESLIVGQVENIDWTSQGAIDHYTVSYSIDGGITYVQIAETDANTTEYDWLVPADLFSVNCLIKVIGFDADDNVVAYDISESYFTIEPTEVISPMFYAGWWLVSVPLLHPDPTKENVIGDDLPGIWDWYQFDYNDPGYWRPADAVPGPGYWLAIAHDTAWIDVEGEALTDTVRRMLDLSWNIIGDPFPAPIPINTILYRYGDKTFSYQEAVDSALIVPVFTGCTPPTGHFESTTLNPWFGYWFMCLRQDLEMLIPPPVALTNPNRDAEGVIPEEYWDVNIQAVADFGADMLTTFGACEVAKDGWDARFDFPEPLQPPDGDWVSTYFVKEGWIDGISNYNRDIRAQMDGGSTVYYLTVATSKPGQVTLTWPNLKDNTTPEYTFILEDEELDVETNMANVSQYTLEVGNQPVVLQIRVTTPKLDIPVENAPVASSIALLSAYPNPFNPQTTISYTTSTASDLTVAVYDLSGKMVANLVNGFTPAGSHSVNWNAVNLSNGIYIVRLQGNGFSATQKVVLMK